METVAHMTTATSATSTPVPCTYVCGPLELCPFGKAKNFPNREGDVDEKGRNVLALSARKFLSKSRGVYSKTLYVGHHANNVGTDLADGCRYAHWDAYTSRAMHEDPQHRCYRARGLLAPEVLQKGTCTQYVKRSLLRCPSRCNVWYSSRARHGLVQAVYDWRVTVRRWY